jgi:hypothetical protein
MNPGSLLCELAKEGSHQFDCHETLPGVFPSEPSHFYAEATHLGTS